MTHLYKKIKYKYIPDIPTMWTHIFSVVLNNKFSIYYPFVTGKKRLQNEIVICNCC